MVHENSCDKCNGMCCRYVATSIDEPIDEKEYEFIRWFLLHENVNVYIDNEDDWFLEFLTPCKMLGKDNKCQFYEQRPNICREHSIESCELYGEGDAFKIKFKGVEEFESYMRKNYIQGQQKTFKKIEED